MCKRIIKTCKNRKCNQLFGVVDNLMQDKKGIWMAECPHCNYQNKLTKKEIKRIALNNVK
jgi:hypothetical protein